MTDWPYRQGIGFDVHRLVAGRKLILGGLEVPYERGLLGHSDADCLVHAVMDALLGALALGDIGQHFPDTDMEYKDISSMKLLDRVMKLIWKKGYILGNIDSVICAEEPKLAPYLPKMRENLARSCSCEKDQVSIKATTTEAMGFVGAKEGIACYATALLVKKDPEDANVIPAESGGGVKEEI